MRPSARSLTADEVAIAGRGAAFTGWHFVRVHAETRGAARFTPFEACVDKDLVEPFVFGHSFHIRKFIREAEQLRSNSLVKKMFNLRGCKFADS